MSDSLHRSGPGGAPIEVADGPSILAQARDGVDVIENGEGTQNIPPEILASIGDLIDDAASWLGDHAGAIVGNAGTAATIMLARMSSPVDGGGVGA
jgi:hypothetical protein